MAFILDLSQSSGDHSGKLETYSVASAHATLLAPGDVIRITGTSDTTTGVALADAAAQAQSITGIMAGIQPIFASENLTETGLPALTAGDIRCHIDPNLNFIVNVTGGDLVADDVGLNIDADITAATKSGGLTISNMAVDSTTKAVTATLQFRIVGLVPDSNGDVDGSVARVRINNSTLRAGVTGV